MEIVKLKNDKSKETKKPADDSKLTITDLKSGVRDQNRVNVFVDGKFSFSLDVAQVVDYHLKIGKILKNVKNIILKLIQILLNPPLIKLRI